MGKKLSAVDIFYIDHHKDKMSPEAIAKQIGCTSRTIYNHIAKSKPVVEEVTPPPSPAEPPKPPAPTPNPNAMAMKLHGKKKNGRSAAVTNTKESSELSDTIFKKGGPTINPDYIHVMNPDKLDEE